MYEVHLQHFEGPLDLLLFFIQRDEIDIHDIPISRITDEYLGYVRQMSEVDLDGAGEFVYFAALLIGIKAKSLLPVSDIDEAGELIDPRRELVERLLEYVRFKEASQGLARLEEARRLHHTRTPADPEAMDISAEAEAVPYRMTLRDLVGSLRRMLTVGAPEPRHAVARMRFTIEAQLATLRSMLQSGARLVFGKLIRRQPRGYVVATLLAVLELAREGALRIRSTQGEDFALEPTSPEAVPDPLEAEPS